MNFYRENLNHEVMKNCTLLNIDVDIISREPLFENVFESSFFLIVCLLNFAERFLNTKSS